MLHGGDSFFYFIGTYSCSDGKLKGEMTHTKQWPDLKTAVA